MYQPYVRITTGNLFTQLDPTPRNTLGIIYSPPVAATLATTTKGYGAQPVVKYVYYNSTTNPAPVAAPAPVYWIDESFTTVSGNAAEGYSAGTGSPSIAGYLLPNSTAISGLTAAQLNQSYCWVQIGGLLVGAYAPTTATGAGIGANIIGVATANWASSTVAEASTPGGRVLAVQYTAIASSACDVLVGGYTTFWGS